MSSFAVSKTLAIFGTLADSLGARINSISDHYASLLFNNANTGYAEVSLYHLVLTTSDNRPAGS